MAINKNQGDPAAALAEELAEAIQVIGKKLRFDASWHEVQPGKDKTRWELLKTEMKDVKHHWKRLKQQILLEEAKKLAQPSEGLINRGL